MATITETEVPEVEVTSIAATKDTDLNKEPSKFSKLRRRFKLGNADGTKRPSGAKWRQQQIPACRPVFTAKHVFVAFGTIGLVFLALGIAFTVILSDLRELSVEYTYCIPSDPIVSSANFSTCDEYVICKSQCLNSTNPVCIAFLAAQGIDLGDNCQTDLPVCQCQVNITADQGLRQVVHVYYALNNYYQNHRRYLNSLDVRQLQGDFLRAPSSDCRPFIDRNINNTPVPILPCGLIANSWFNDTIYQIQDTGTINRTSYTINTNNIAWETDRDVRFNNSAANPPRLSPGQVEKPPNWPTGILGVLNGLNNESLIVWFRVSAFPWFRKLYGRIYSDMPASTYTVTISYSYPVTDFNGAKSVILAEVSWLGGRNLFLGIAYIVVGVFLIVAGIVLLLVHLFRSKWKISDKNFLNREY